MYLINLKTQVAISNHYDYPSVTREVNMVGISNRGGITKKRDGFYAQDFTLSVFVTSKLEGKIMSQYFEEYKLNALDIPEDFQIPTSLQTNPTTYKKIDVTNGSKIFPYVSPPETVGYRYASRGNLLPIDLNGDLLDWETEQFIINKEEVDAGPMDGIDPIPVYQTRRKVNPNWNSPQYVSEGFYWNSAIASGNLDTAKISPIIILENNLGRFDFKENLIK